jgi:hypothetical protein
MIASRTGEEPQVLQVTVRCRVLGGPWYVVLGGLGVPDVEFGPYENPAVAREDAARLRRFLDIMILTLAKMRAEPSERAWLGTEPQLRDDIMNTALNRTDAAAAIPVAISTMKDRELESAVDPILK